MITKSPILHPHAREYDKKQIKDVKPQFIKIGFGNGDWKFFGGRGNRCARWKIKLYPPPLRNTKYNFCNLIFLSFSMITYLYIIYLYQLILIIKS